MRTWRARPPSTIGGYSQERVRIAHDLGAYRHAEFPPGHGSTSRFVFDLGSSESAAELLARADAALYEAKLAGATARGSLARRELLSTH